MTEPLQEMAEIYRTYLFDGFRWDTEGLFALFGDMIWHRPAMVILRPTRHRCGRCLLDRLDALHQEPAETGRARQAKEEAYEISLKARINRYRANLTPAAIEDGSLIGVDQKSGAAGSSDRQGRQASHAGAGAPPAAARR